MSEQVKVTIDVSLDEIGTISALLDHMKPGSAIQKRWDDLFKNTHQAVFGTYGVRRIDIPRRYN